MWPRDLEYLGGLGGGVPGVLVVAEKFVSLNCVVSRLVVLRSLRSVQDPRRLGERDLREGEVKFLCLAVRKCWRGEEVSSL